MTERVSERENAREQASYNSGACGASRLKSKLSSFGLVLFFIKEILKPYNLRETFQLRFLYNVRGTRG